MARASVVVLIVAVLVVAVAIVALSYAPDATSDVKLFESGGVEGETGTMVTGGAPPGSQLPPGGQPPPPPGNSNAIGTYSIYASVLFTDGTSSAVTGSQGFATAPYYSGKAISEFRYEGRFTAAQDVSMPAGNFQHTALEIYDSAGTFHRGFDPNTPAILTKGETKTVLSASVPAVDVFPSSRSAGTYSVSWTAILEFVYPKNGTHSPRFFLTSPTLTVNVQDQAGGFGGGGGGGGCGLNPCYAYLSVVDPRVWAAMFRGE